MMKKRGKQIIEASVVMALVIIVTFLAIGGVLALDVEQTVRVNVLAGNISLFSPVESNIYTNRMVPINISMNSEVDYFRYIDNGGRARTLCRRCDEYGFNRLKRKSFDDGVHSLDVIGVFPNGEIVDNVNFVVDTKNPRIRRTLPRQRRFGDGVFSFKFQEANPVESWLNYGNSVVGYRNVSIDLGVNGVGGDCFLERSNTLCEKWVNLSDYDGGEVSYWFNLTDIVGNGVESKKVDRIKVDVSVPVVNVFDYVVDGRRVEFMFDVSDANFDEINYIDYNDNNPKWKRLCSRLRNGVCEIRKSFRRGEHNLSFEVLDEVENSVVIDGVGFVVG